MVYNLKELKYFWKSYCCRRSFGENTDFLESQLLNFQKKYYCIISDLFLSFIKLDFGRWRSQALSWASSSIWCEGIILLLGLKYFDMREFMITFAFVVNLQYIKLSCVNSAKIIYVGEILSTKSQPHKFVHSQYIGKWISCSWEKFIRPKISSFFNYCCLL